MAYDKVVDSAKLDADLKSVADTIKAKTGTTGKLEFPDGFISDVGTLVKAEDYLAALLNKTVTELISETATHVPGDFQLGNKNLVKVYLPSATTVQGGAFNQCSNLAELNLDSLTQLEASTFESCHSLIEVTLPSLTNITGWGYTFNNCTNLAKVKLPVFTGATSTRTFNACQRLTALILGADTVCTLSSTDVFGGTPIASGTGYIYVKKALINSYKTATNWSTFAAQFRAIEDFPDICG